MHLRRIFAIAAVAFCLLPAFALVERSEPFKEHLVVEPPAAGRSVARLDPQEVSPLASAARAFLSHEGGAWIFRQDRRTGKLTLAQGAGVPLIPGKGNDLEPQMLQALDLQDGKLSAESLDPLVRTFLQRNAALLLPERGVLVLNLESSQIRENGRLISLYYDWSIDGVPVEGATVFVRLNSGNITQFGAPLVGPTNVDTTPRISSDEAVRRLLSYAGDRETARLQGTPELLLQPEDGESGKLVYRLVWTLTYRLFGRLETWEGRIDAKTGQVVGFRDLNAYARAVGGVYPRTVYEDNETSVPMPLLSVSAAAGNVVTDSAGSFVYAGGDASSFLDGEWFDTSCQGCSNPPQPVTSIDGGIGFLDFGLGGLDAVGNGFSTPADRNSFYHLNQVRRLGLKWMPALGFLFNTSFASNVNISSTCNAVYTGNAVNFYRSGGGCNNTGEIADVMQHEYGHGIDQNTQPGDGATGEATADIVAMHMTHSPLVGPGFRTDGSPVRNLDSATSATGFISIANIGSICGTNGTTGPLGFEVHCEGEIYGQVAWDLSLALVAKHGQHTGWRASERIFFNSLPDARGYLPGDSMPVYDAYIQADDDDGNLANGTPNALEIFNVFDSHGMANAQVPTSPSCSRPAQPVLSVTAQCAQVDLSWPTVAGVDHYVVFRSEWLEDTAYFELAQLGPSATSFTDTEVAPDFDYFYTVMAVTLAGCESTVESPRAARLTDQAVLSVTAFATDDVPMGNRSGFADPGEQVDLVLTLGNVGQFDATSVTGQVTSVTPGVTLVLGTAGWPDLNTGDAQLSSTALRFETDADVVSCGDLLEFQLAPGDALGCDGQPSFFTVRLGEFVDGGYICDDTPACFVEPTFSGLQAANTGVSCGEIDLAWPAAESNCVNAAISYNVYRSTDPGFTPGPQNLVYEGIGGTSLTDFALEPGQLYHYVVRAFDSRSGEEGNSVALSAVAPLTPDISAPVFSGLQSADSGLRCGEAILGWQPAIETCNAPVAYEIHRATDPGFVPGPGTLVATTLSTAFIDTSADPGFEYTYLVRARDGLGNVDANGVKRTMLPGAEPLELVGTGFENSDNPPNGAGWAAIEPNDASPEGRWAWGDPVGTNYQPDNDATPPPGSNCWITGLGTASNGDVDGGTTTLLSSSYDMSGFADPVVEYRRWFTNDRGASPGDSTDTFKVDVSNDDGQSWTPLEEVGAGTPLSWVAVQLELPLPATNQMRFRFSAADLGDGSLVEAGVDEFALVDARAGCDDCFFPPAQTLCEIGVSKSGDDIIVDWSATPILDSRVVVYDVKSCNELVKIGTVDGGASFVHEEAALSSEAFRYRVTFVDSCGEEIAFCGQTDCP